MRPRIVVIVVSSTGQRASAGIQLTARAVDSVPEGLAETGDQADPGYAIEDVELDRDKLYMMLDSVYVLGPEDGRSVASVVERDPIAIMGNSLVYRVAGGAFLGVDGHKSPAALDHYYRDTAAKSEPIRVSLPTSGLYAQAVMDECEEFLRLPDFVGLLLESFDEVFVEHVFGNPAGMVHQHSERDRFCVRQPVEPQLGA